MHLTLKEVLLNILLTRGILLQNNSKHIKSMSDSYDFKHQNRNLLKNLGIIDKEITISNSQNGIFDNK